MKDEGDQWFDHPHLSFRNLIDRNRMKSLGLVDKK